MKCFQVNSYKLCNVTNVINEKLVVVMTAWGNDRAGMVSRKQDPPPQKKCKNKFFTCNKWRTSHATYTQYTPVWTATWHNHELNLFNTIKIWATHFVRTSHYNTKLQDLSLQYTWNSYKYPRTKICIKTWKSWRNSSSLVKSLNLITSMCHLFNDWIVTNQQAWSLE